MPRPDLFSAGPEQGARQLRWIRILLGAIVLVFVGAGFLYFKSQSLVTPTDPNTLCPTKQSPTEVVVILLDPSNRLGKPQEIQLRSIIDRVATQVSRFGLVEVYRIPASASDVPEPVLHLCNPGSADEISSVYSNPDFVARKWRMFTDSVMSTVTRETTADEQATSPIFEGVQAIGVRSFGRRMFDHSPKHLVIVSDLLQNVPGKVNMYRSIPSFDDFRSTTYYKQIRADLTEVHVFVVYINRPLVTAQGRQHIGFWERYLLDQRAVLDSVVQLFGDR